MVNTAVHLTPTQASFLCAAADSVEAEGNMAEADPR
jgi:hypothetical protein